ncbi:MAG TPA: thioredoxin family protein [Pyrinomonadaceae bacterium]|nr:thioredoxin family protein [Pyrinomonadaceae bacterium]
MQNYIEKAMTFDEYSRLIDRVVAEGKTTGPNQSEEFAQYTKLNQSRMRRLFKTSELNESLLETARNVKANWIWLILTEAWCGDAAQNIPPIEKIARENDRIKTLYLLRDENLELMDKYLTNGARAIPKLICLDAETFEEIGTWGSRPQAAYDVF